MSAKKHMKDLTIQFLLPHTPTKRQTKNVRLISFRDLVPEVPSTTYASHGMYYYPARFIPQTVRWALQNYTEPGDWVIDPFAGSGTVCIESLITNRNSASYDLNPMLDHLLKAKTYRGADWTDLQRRGDAILAHRKHYEPSWSRIRYWHPDEFFELLSRMWSGYRESPHPLLLIALLRTTRRYSFADGVVPKLFRSKRKVAEVGQMLNSDFRSDMREYFRNVLRKTFDASMEFERYYAGGHAKWVAGVDLVEKEVRGRYRLLITSPPYGQAHEYIRSFKLDLAWLGFTDKQITSLINREIPYNKWAPDIEIMSPTLRRLSAKVAEHVAHYCDVYFRSVIYILGKAMDRINPGGHAAIFVGNATYAGLEMPYHKIFAEHFSRCGFEQVSILKDHIKGRRLFKGRLNPSPNGIASEYLLVLRKKN